MDPPIDIKGNNKLSIAKETLETGKFFLQRIYFKYFYLLIVSGNRILIRTYGHKKKLL